MAVVRKLSSVNLVAKTNITKNTAILLHEQSEGIERHIVVTGIDKNTQILEFSKDLDIYSKGTFLVGSAGAEADWDDSTGDSLTLATGTDATTWKLIDFGDIEERVVYANLAVGGDGLATITISVSNDNVTYTTLMYLNVGAATSLIDVKKATFRYMKITYSNTSSLYTGTVTLNSVEVFNVNDALTNITLSDNKFIDVTVKTDKEKYNVFILTTNCNYAVYDLDYTDIGYIYAEEVQ